MQKYGLIGKKLAYSFSKIIHEKLFEIYKIDARYELIEVSELTTELLTAYAGVNITIPYKQEVIKYLDENHCPFSSCNTAKNDEGHLSGYNTDIFGFDFMIQQMNVQNIEKVVILGSGASSKMLQHYFKDKAVTVVSRTDEFHNYTSLKDMKADILINATPVGMMEYKSPIAEELVGNFRAVFDLNYNPLNSQLRQFCQRQKVPFINGLSMLIEQAIKAFEIWHAVSVEESVFAEIYQEICLQVSTKIAIVGMPLAGKTTMIRKFQGVDLDDVVIEREADSIPKLIEQGVFREKETAALNFLVQQGKSLIALGGGAVLKQENIELLQEYLIVFLDTPLEILKERSKTNFRPLIQKEEDLLNLYQQRYPRYQEIANLILGSEQLENLLTASQKL